MSAVIVRGVVSAVLVMLASSASSFGEPSHFVPAGPGFEQDVKLLERYQAESPPPNTFKEMVRGYTAPGFYDPLPNGLDLDAKDVRQIASELAAYESRLRSYHAEFNTWWLPVGPKRRHADYIETYPQSTAPVPRMTGETSWTFGGGWSLKGVIVGLTPSLRSDFIHYVADGEGWLRTRVTRLDPEGTSRTSGLIRMLSPNDRGNQPFPDSALGRDLMRSWSPLTLMQSVAATHTTLHGRKLDDGSIVLRGPLTIAEVPGAFGILIRTRPDLGYAPTEIVLYDGRFALPLAVSLFAEHHNFGAKSESIHLPRLIARVGLIPDLHKELIEGVYEKAITHHNVDIGPDSRETTIANPIWAKLTRDAIEEAHARSFYGPFGWGYAVLTYRSVNQPLPADVMNIELPENADIGDQRDSTMRRWDGQQLLINPPGTPVNGDE